MHRRLLLIALASGGLLGGCHTLGYTFGGGEGLPCSSDEACPEGQVCDTEAETCKEGTSEAGQQGCGDAINDVIACGSDADCITGVNAQLCEDARAAMGDVVDCIASDSYCETSCTVTPSQCRTCLEGVCGSQFETCNATTC